MCVTAVPSKKCFITLLRLQRKQIPFQHIDCFVSKHVEYMGYTLKPGCTYGFSLPNDGGSQRWRSRIVESLRDGSDKGKAAQCCIFLTGWNKTQCMNWSSSRFSKTNFSPNSWLVLLPLIDAKCGPNLVGPVHERERSQLLKLVRWFLRCTWEWHSNTWLALSENWNVKGFRTAKTGCTSCPAFISKFWPVCQFQVSSLTPLPPHSVVCCVLEQLRNAKTSKQDGRIIWVDNRKTTYRSDSSIHQVISVLCCDFGSSSGWKIRCCLGIS